MVKEIKIKEWKGEPFRYAHAKLDGNWLSIRREADGLVHAYSSLGTDLSERITRADYEWWRQAVKVLLAEDEGVELQGEMYLPGQPASDVKSFLPGQQFAVFCVPHLGDCDLREVEVWCRAYGLEFAEFTTNQDLDPQCLLAIAANKGYEGWVLKQSHLAGWFKLKEKLTADLRVAGFKDGQGKFLGLVGSLIVADETGRIVANASGFNDMTRVMIDEGTDLGRICEIEYQYVGSRGKLRHPRFKRWRDDKTTADVIEVPAE